MQTGINMIQETGAAIVEIVNNVQLITENIEQIAAGNQEQSTTLAEFSQNISNLASSAQNTISYAHETGKGIYQISQELIELRNNRINQAQNFSLSEELEIAKTDHICWAWQIYNMLLGYEEIDENKLDNHQTCRLGKWLDTTQGQTIKSLPSFENLEEPHKRLHELGFAAVAAYKNNESEKVESLYEQIQQTSSEVINVLNHLLAEVAKNNN